MTDVIDGAKSLEAPAEGMVMLDDLDQQLIGQLVDRARSQGLRLTGEDGLLAPADQDDRRVLALSAEDVGTCQCSSQDRRNRRPSTSLRITSS